MPQAVVRLNVGGTLFATTRSTLNRVPFFDRLTDGSFDDLDEDGVAFIDRDPRYFAAILSFLRCGRFELPSGASL